jgi:hypothetical protein
MQHTAILWPCMAMVFLTAVVWVRLFVERIGEMRERQIHPQSVATSKAVVEKLQRLQAADNFRNLFEMPVLFYVLCLALLQTGMGQGWMLGMAWAYVVLRIIHSSIQCTYNKVMHRFRVYLLSGTLLFVMWGLFAWQFWRGV